MGQKDPLEKPEHARVDETVELLSTKLTPPRLQRLFVPRVSLLARLDEGLDQKLTLISAPAGFGKSTLVSEWLAQGREGTDFPPVAWVSLDPGDNDPSRFWRYVLTASKAFGDGVSEPALAVLNSAPRPPFQALLTLFINGLASLSSKAVLVLEDYHLISSAQLHEALAFFLDHLPPALHVVLMTRSDPPLPLARLRARNELNEIRAADLRFSLAEVKAFLDQALPVDLPSEMVSRIASRTEGWIAGLRLVTLALRSQGEALKIDQFLDTFTGSHRPVMDYLVGDVFNAQPEPLQQFMLQTSVLSRLTGSLCDAITGRNDSALLLEQLERDNLFLVSLDASQQWYRFHALFAEAMRHVAQQRFGEEWLCKRFYAASVWYEEHGMLAEAIEAALSSQEYSRAADLIERVIEPRLVQNEYHTLRRWIEQLPVEVLRTHPTLCMSYTTAVLFTSDRQTPQLFELIEPPLQMAEEYWRSEGNSPKLGQVMAVRAIAAWRQNDFPGSFLAARQALELLPEDDLQWRGASLVFAGLEEVFAGRLNAARRTFTQALTLNEAARNNYAAINSTQNLGEVYARQGELRQATQLFQQVLAAIERAPMDREDRLLRRGRALLGLGALSMEWNDLEAAQQAGSEAHEIASQLADENLLVASTIILARLQCILGNVEQAQGLLRELLPQAKNPSLRREIQAHQAWLALRAGDRNTARIWHDNLAQSRGATARYQQELEALIVSRLLAVEGNGEQAYRLLEEWLLEAQEQGRVRSVLEIKVLMVLMLSELGDSPRSKETLIQALELAHPEGYRRTFLDEGQPLARLLRATLPEMQNAALAAYARSLLYTIAKEPTRQDALTDTALQPLIEPLSEQEQRVLQLLAAGLSNPQIAEELVISVNTVKTHVKNIYGKLGVNSREQARDAARHLK